MTNQDTSPLRPTGEIATRSTLGFGALYGAIAYVLGVVATFALVAIDDNLGAETVSGFQLDGGPSDIGFAGLDPSALDFAGWIFYNAHFVETIQRSEASNADGRIGLEQNGNILSDVTTQIPEVVYYLVPVLVLTAAGYLLARQLAPENSIDGVLAGSSLAVGYFPLVILGSVFFRQTQSVTISGVEFSVTVAPNLAMAIIIAGIVVPVMFGAIGGLLESS